MTETIEIAEGLEVDVTDERVHFRKRRDTVNLNADEFEEVVEAYLRQRRKSREEE
ncbi:hypothetical protein [Natrinema gari]|uniref:hypothetical protein n=1 Tax=Natrinema gari TaxID=419186 RepID=UPI00135F1553|nr:hypothetical protein [Natrinema gari]